jgi:RimJ/RimL family protein N-acetyltransferase
MGAGVELHTPRLVLRPARAEDLPAIHAIMRQPKAMAYWSTPPHDTLEQTREWLSGMIAIPAALGEDFVIEMATGDQAGTVIGKAGFYRFPEIGYMLDPACWGQGLAREAVSAVIERGFAAHALDLVRADVDPRNLASLGLLARLGFTETARAEKTWLVGDMWCDSVYLELTPRDWGWRTA